MRVLIILGGLRGFPCLFGVRLCGLPLGYRFLISVGGSKAAEVQRVWDIYDDRLQFMSRDDAFSLDDSLIRGDVSSAWLVWSSAVEAALADAYRFAGGPVPDDGLVLGRGVFRTRFVRLGGPKVRKARRKFADPQEGGDVSLYHDVSTASFASSQA